MKLIHQKRGKKARCDCDRRNTPQSYFCAVYISSTWNYSAVTTVKNYTRPTAVRAQCDFEEGTSILLKNLAPKQESWTIAQFPLYQCYLRIWQEVIISDTEETCRIKAIYAPGLMYRHLVNQPASDLSRCYVAIFLRLTEANSIAPMPSNRSLGVEIHCIH